MKKVALLVLSVVAFAAQADDKMDWKPCDKEVKEFKCAGDDKTVWACLEKHDEKLSAACQAVHATGDAKFKK